MDMNKKVCQCYDITYAQVKEAIDNGATTLEEVQEATEAGTACGACVDDLDRLVNYFLTKKID